MRSVSARAIAEHVALLHETVGPTTATTRGQVREREQMVRRIHKEQVAA